MNNQNTIKMKTAILYARTACQTQAATINQLESQLNDLNKYCEKNNIMVIDVYSEVGSGIDPQREKLTQLIKDLKQGIVKADQLLITKWDRLSRDFKMMVRIVEELETTGILPAAILEPLESDIIYKVIKRLISRKNDRIKKMKK